MCLMGELLMLAAMRLLGFTSMGIDPFLTLFFSVAFLIIIGFNSV